VGNETVPPEPTSYYGVTKLASEQLALAFYRDRKLPVTVARLFSVYGERERPEKLYPRLIGSILNDKEFPLYEGSLKHLRSYTYVSDIIDGLVRIMDQKDQTIGEIFNIGNDKTITTGQGVALIEKYLNKKAKLKNMPRRPGDQIETSADISKARKILKYSPQVSPEEGLKREVEWYKNFVHGKL
jgi:nucleoside-diphosphate-sugar epimerase